MTFTNELPTSEGMFAWRLHEKAEPEGCSVRLVNGVMTALAGTSECPVAKTGGQWCRLVPANELELAHQEAHGEDGVEWACSRAKRVMEGKE